MSWLTLAGVTFFAPIQALLERAQRYHVPAASGEGSTAARPVPAMGGWPADSMASQRKNVRLLFGVTGASGGG
jgi:hypothetical protein